MEITRLPRQSLSITTLLPKGAEEKGLCPFYGESAFSDLNGIVDGRKLRCTSRNNVLMRSGREGNSSFLTILMKRNCRDK